MKTYNKSNEYNKSHNLKTAQCEDIDVGVARDVSTIYLLTKQQMRIYVENWHKKYLHIYIFLSSCSSSPSSNTKTKHGFLRITSSIVYSLINWVVWCSFSQKKKHISQATLSILDSGTWKWIYLSRDSALSCMSRHLINGQSLLWYDSWLTQSRLIDEVHHAPVLTAVLNLAWYSGEWLQAYDTLWAPLNLASVLKLWRLIADLDGESPSEKYYAGRTLRLSRSGS